MRYSRQQTSRLVAPGDNDIYGEFRACVEHVFYVGAAGDDQTAVAMTGIMPKGQRRDIAAVNFISASETQALRYFNAK